MKRKIILTISMLLVSAISVSKAMARNEDHCVVTISPVQEGEKFSEVSSPVCFGTFREAIQYATSGAVNLEKGITPKMTTDEMLNASAIQTDYLIGIDYENSLFGGSTLSWRVSNVDGCTNNASYAVSSMPLGWDNRVSSAKSYMGCDHYYHYQYTFYGGVAIDCGSSCSSMGTMNDATSSEKWTP